MSLLECVATVTYQLGDHQYFVIRRAAGISSISTAINCLREQFWQTVNRWIVVCGELIDGFKVEVIVAQF